MRRSWMLPALFACVLACKGSESSGKAEATSAGEAKPDGDGPPLTLPTVELPDAGPGSVDTRLWITADAIWVGHADAAPERVVELKSITADGPELIEALAEALHRISETRTDGEFIIDPLGTGYELGLSVDAKTSVGVLRRVLTTARATGYRRFRYQAAHSSVELPADRPLRDPHDYDEVVSIGHTPEDGFTLNLRPLAEDELFRTLERVLATRENQCVALELGLDVEYAAWLELVAKLARHDVACLTVPSPAVPADQPPPPPPPPALDDELPPPEAAPSKPEPGPDTTRVEHWWAESHALVEQKERARCERTLTTLREIADADLSIEQIQQLGNLEDGCGDPARAEALWVLRTERFPDDWSGWFQLALHRFDPIYPEPDAKLPYREEIEPAQRRAIATSVLEALAKARALAPNRPEIEVWAAMAHTQLAHAWAADPSDEGQRRARVERMRAWQRTQIICASKPDLGCPPAPSSEAEFAADLAALGAALGEH